MKYRKKPVVIEAFKLGHHVIPDWFFDKVIIKEIILHRVDGKELQRAELRDPFERIEIYCIIKTLEGEMKGDFGDFIIQGVQGEIYPCKPDIFEATYEQVE